MLYPWNKKKKPEKKNFSEIEREQKQESRNNKLNRKKKMTRQSRKQNKNTVGKPEIQLRRLEKQFPNNNNFQK